MFRNTEAERRYLPQKSAFYVKFANGLAYTLNMYKIRILNTDHVRKTSVLV